ncbi:aspartate 1-decarboxylase [Staphylococcus aureus]
MYLVGYENDINQVLCPSYQGFRIYGQTLSRFSCATEPNEKVAIVNNNNGARFETYVIAGERGSGKICLNGAASRLVEVGDVVIIMTYAQLNEEEIKNHAPKVAVMNEDNVIIEMIHEKENTIVL